MADREKLIELLKEADRKAYEVLESRPLAHPFEVWDIQADHLIANGVTINKGTECTPVAYNLSPTEPLTNGQQTNADLIRAMDDELLATQLTQVFEEGVMTLAKKEVPTEILNEVRSQILEKLKQPAEGD